MKKELAIVLASGGMDSCVSTAIAAVEYELAFLHVNYGQLTEQRELKAFNEIADYYEVENNYRLIADISYLTKIGGSSLTDRKVEMDMDGGDDNGTQNTYVPFRNTHFLTIAVSWAEVIGAKAIVIGAVAQDQPGYPDCKPEYFNIFNKLAEAGTKVSTKVKIITPVIEFTKNEIVKKGTELNAPLNLTWSCYKDSDVACGKCNSCVLRLNAFQKAGIKDPIQYKS